MLLYIAGKVNKNSQFGTSHWRDDFVAELSRLSGMDLAHLDPLKYEAITGDYQPQAIFDKDCWLINQVDCVIVYLSDDISVGGSQEMMIAKYLKKTLIGLAPYEGKFHKSVKEMPHQTVENYVDPFVYATCDVVCGDVSEVAVALKNLPETAKTITIIDEAIARAEITMGEI